MGTLTLSITFLRLKVGEGLFYFSGTLSHLRQANEEESNGESWQKKPKVYPSGASPHLKRFSATESCEARVTGRARHHQPGARASSSQSGGNVRGHAKQTLRQEKARWSQPDLLDSLLYQTGVKQNQYMSLLP